MKRLMYIMVVCSLAFFATVDMAYAGGRHRNGGGRRFRGCSSSMNASKGTGQSRGNRQNRGSGQSKAKYDLTTEQEEALIFMYQEEKLARDVYDALGDQWELRPFLKIKKAEQKHMDAVGRLLDKYGITRPVGDTPGEFADSSLQSLYNELVEKGLQSEVDALETGRLIEITDIKDLEERIKDSTPDVKRVFSKLKRGSYNHLRAFERNLKKY